MKKKEMLKTLKKETGRVVPILLFFLFFFTLINFAETYLYKKAGLTPFHFAEIAISAALIAKIMFVLDHFFFLHRFKKIALIYVIFLKINVYFFSLIFVRLCIHFIPFLLRKGQSFTSDYEAWLYTVDWGLFFSVQIFYLMLLFIFVTFRELSFKLGFNKMKDIFLR